MITKVEVDADGRPLRVFHRAWDNAGDRARSWTHGIEARPECSACQAGRVPPDVARGEGKAIR